MRNEIIAMLKRDLKKAKADVAKMERAGVKTILEFYKKKVAALESEIASYK